MSIDDLLTWMLDTILKKLQGFDKLYPVILTQEEDHPDLVKLNVPVWKDEFGELNKALNHAITKIETNKVIIILGDIPSVKPNIIQAIFELLNQYRIAITPTLDGGTGVLGLQLPTSITFHYGRNSFNKFLEECRSKKELMVQVFQNPGLTDIDSPSDLAIAIQEDPSLKESLPNKYLELL